MAVATPTPDESRERLINGLYEPVRRIVRAVDETANALAAGDSARLREAVHAAKRRVNEYLQGVEG